MSEQIELVELKPRGYVVTYSTHDWSGGTYYSHCREVKAAGASREEAIENCFNNLRARIDTFLSTEVVTPDGDLISLKSFNELPRYIPVNCGIFYVRFDRIVAVPLGSQVRVITLAGNCSSGFLGNKPEELYRIDKTIYLGSGLQNRLGSVHRYRDYFNEVHFPEGSFIGNPKREEHPWSKLESKYTEKSWEQAVRNS